MEKVSLDPEFENAVRICPDLAVKGTPNTGIGLYSGSEDEGAEKSSGTGAGRTSAQVGLRPFSLQRPTLSNSAQPQTRDPRALHTLLASGHPSSSTCPRQLGGL